MDKVDQRISDYSILEDDKQREIRDHAAINHGFEKSTEKHSTDYFIVEDDTEECGTREVSCNEWDVIVFNCCSYDSSLLSLYNYVPVIV